MLSADRPRGRRRNGSADGGAAGISAPTSAASTVPDPQGGELEQTVQQLFWTLVVLVPFVFFGGGLFALFAQEGKS